MRMRICHALETYKMWGSQWGHRRLQATLTHILSQYTYGITSWKAACWLSLDH